MRVGLITMAVWRCTEYAGAAVVRMCGCEGVGPQRHERLRLPLPPSPVARRVRAGVGRSESEWVGVTAVGARYRYYECWSRCYSERENVLDVTVTATATNAVVS
jgi:hypothetical protein